MAFRARKTRERKAPEPVFMGKPIVPSAGLRMWYEGQLLDVLQPMLEDYRASITQALATRSIQKFFAQDAAAAASLSDTLEALDKKWKSVFKEYGKRTSKKFVEKANVEATNATLFSLKAAGVDQPRSTYNDNVANTLGASQLFNNTLITNIQQETHEKIYNAVMLSLTSPDPEKQGQSAIVSALKDAGISAKKRVKLIARDQTSKMYASLSEDRMRENGVTKFKWLHSSAGKVPRQTHVDKDGEIFELDDPRLWEGPKSDQGPPGWAINCRCRAVPVIGD